ncbi:uncharacterized protein LOC111391015 [Olea europaea var. sylvestris]|uniref:uncharacterized protein LOC111391015 n=1 Tax=Olea europaea var. sylvestris TaxID=158386 RepID=UPI000C1D7E1F|nr:uncharacterized protein LOC111391015 [Olea europaea var. sylvestris]
MWTKHVDFNDLISDCWNFYLRGTKQFIICKKLSKLKGVLKELNSKHFGHISDSAIEAKNKLESAQLQLHNQPSNADFQVLVAKLRKKTVTLCEAEHSFYYQKAKCVFLKESDKCTKFFHSLVKRSSKRNFIATVFKEDGMYTTSQDEVAREFVNFYTSLLGKKCSSRPSDVDILSNGPLVSSEQGNTLIRDISYEEIKDALFDIGDDKSPRPDGYTSYFFKNAWGIISDDFVGAILEFFSSGCILKQINHTTIALVPKSDHTQHVGDFRPISCCNVTYKVSAKILASRLIPILGDIVDHAQAAFVEGRSIMENIHLANKLLRQYNRKRVAPRYLLKIDISKAYVRLLKAAIYDSDFNFHPKCGPQKINHLAFADNLILFARGDFMSVKILMDCLSNFGSVSRLRLNVLKSSLFTAGGHGQLLEEIMELTSVPMGSMPFRYLGIPLASDKLKLNGTCIWEVCPRKDHSPLFKKILEIRDILCVYAAAQQISINGQQGGTVHMDAGIAPSRWAVNGRIYNAGNQLNWPINGQYLDSNTGRQFPSFGRQFLEIWNENLGCSIGEKFSTKIAYNFFRLKGTFKPWGTEVWKSCITPKHSFILWLGAQSKVLTKDKLLFLDIDRC